MSALTGPVARGDIGTIRKHLRSLHEKLPHYLQTYCAMGILTTDLGVEKKTLPDEEAAAIKKLLRGELKNE